MIQRFFMWLLEDVINQLVDKRIEENIIEKLRQQSEQARKQRIAKLRATLDHQTSTSNQNKTTKVQPGDRVYPRSEEPKLSPPPDQAAIKRQQEMAAIKAKLLGKKA